MGHWAHKTLLLIKPARLTYLWFKREKWFSPKIVNCVSTPSMPLMQVKMTIHLTITESECLKRLKQQDQFCQYNRNNISLCTDLSSPISLQKQRKCGMAAHKLCILVHHLVVRILNPKLPSVTVLFGRTETLECATV